MEKKQSNNKLNNLNKLLLLISIILLIIMLSIFHSKRNSLARLVRYVPNQPDAFPFIPERKKKTLPWRRVFNGSVNDVEQAGKADLPCPF